MTNKKTSRKNNRSKPKRQGSAKVSPFGSTPLLPANRRVKLAYCEQIPLGEPVAGAGITFALSLNSLYDPNAGGTGQQPVGFDQISAMYLQHRVWSCRVKITCQNDMTASPASVMMFATFQPAVPASPYAWFCQPYGCTGSIEPRGGRSSCVMEKTFDIPAVLGLTKQQYTADMDFVGTSSGNPTRQAYLNFGHKSYAGTPIGIVWYMVQLEYTVEFSQPYALNMS